MASKKNGIWKAVGDSRKVPGVYINIDVHGNPYFQARYEVSETKMVDGIQHVRVREKLGEAVYVGHFGRTKMYTQHPDFILAAQVLKALWPTIQAVTNDFSKV